MKINLKYTASSLSGSHKTTGIFVLIFAVIGTVIVLTVRAATLTTTVDTTSGTLSGNISSCTNSSSINGKVIWFGSMYCGGSAPSTSSSPSTPPKISGSSSSGSSSSSGGSTSSGGGSTSGSGSTSPTTNTCPSPTPVAPVTGYTIVECEDFNSGLGDFGPYSGGGSGTVVGTGRTPSQCTVTGGMLELKQSSDGATCGGWMNGFDQRYGYWEVKMRAYSTGSSSSSEPH